jgi:hypothetical protein
LHLSFEELSYYRNPLYKLNDNLTAAALLDVLRRCSRLHKVSLTGDSLRSVDPAALLPYGHLFHELNLIGEDDTFADAQAMSTLLATCSNLRKLSYNGAEDGHSNLVVAAIHQSCPLLEELALRSISFNQQEQIAGAVTGTGAGFFALINRNCRHLRKLTLLSCQLSTSILQGFAATESLTEVKLDDCGGLTDSDIAVLATMKLESLYLHASDSQLTGSFVQSFVGSSISQTLADFFFFQLQHDADR